VEQIRRHLGADHAHRPAAGGIHAGQETALRNAHAAREQVFLGGPEDPDTAGAAGLVFQGPAEIRSGRDGAGKGQLAGQRPGVRNRDLAALLFLEPVRFAVIHPAVALHIEHVRAE